MSVSGVLIMLLINKLTAPGTIKRIELRPDIVRVVFTNGTERIYHDKESGYKDMADYGYLDAIAGRKEQG